MRERSTGLLVSTRAASLMTTAGVDGSSFGMYGFEGVVSPCDAALASGELEGGRGGGGAALVALGGTDVDGWIAGEVVAACGVGGGCEGPMTTGAMPSKVCFFFGFGVC